MNRAYSKSKEDVLKELSTTIEGISTAEAKARIERYGKNEIQEGKRKNTFQVFLEQFKDFLVIILIVAAVVSMFLGDLEGAIVILVVITLNAILGTVQHVKAEQSLNSLKALSCLLYTSPSPRD